MIDLERYGLPDTIKVDGEEYEIVTNFRTWMTVQRLFGETKILDGRLIFPGGAPEGDWREAALEFMTCPNNIPKSKPSNVRTLDLLEDSDYIVAAFIQAYGIDLTTCSMHWHKFLALLRGLPGDTKLAEIMGYRSWKSGKRKVETVRKEARDTWALPVEGDADLVEVQKSMFGGING